MDSFLGGFAAAGATDAVFYGVDSYKTQLQAEGGTGTARRWTPARVAGLFRGAGPVALMPTLTLMVTHTLTFTLTLTLTRTRKGYRARVCSIHRSLLCHLR